MKKINKLLLIIFILFIIPIKFVLADDSVGTFSDLQQLINENTDGKLILEKDYTNNGSEPQITISKDIILDLNGHIINGRYVNRIFYVSNNAHLTIDDSNKTIIHKFDVDKWLLATLNETDGEVTVNGGCITAGDVSSESTNKTHQNGKGSAIYINSGSLTINSGNIIGNKISDKFQFGAGIAAENNSIITIKGGMVSYNRATWEGYGAGIYLNNSDLIIDGGTISYNYGIYGGGINAYDGSSIIMNSGNISNNIAGHNGAGIALMVYDQNIPLGYVSQATINGGVIENNTVVTPWVGVGGGISTDKSTELTINGGTIQKNKAARGAGVGAWTGGDIKIYGGVIKENISTEDTTPDDGSTGNYGAGVFFNTYFIGGYGSVDANLTIGGSAIITGNINDVTKKEDNLFLANDQTINIGANEYSPTNKMNVGITMANPGVFTVSETDYAENFYSDNVNYYVIKENNNLKLVEDKVAPTGEIIFEEKTFTSFLNTITFGLFFKDKFDVTITANDNNKIKSIEYYISDIGMSLDEVKAITNWIEYEEFSIDSDDKYVIYAKITDRAENVTYLSSDGFIFDKTLPEVSGIDSNNGIYFTTQKFTVDDDNIDKVLINGVEVDEYILPGNVLETYEIDVIDKAGNATYISISMMPISVISGLIDGIDLDNVKSSDKEDIEYVIDKVSSIDLTNATLEEKEEIQEIKDNCNILLEKIDEVFDELKETSDAVELYKDKELGEEDKLNIRNKIINAKSINEDNLTDDENDNHNSNIKALEDLLDGIYTYEFVSGNNQELIRGNIDDYSFEIDGDSMLFKSLEINNLLFEKDIDFNIADDVNTIVTLTDGGINKLTTLYAGEYSVKVSYLNSKIVIGKVIIKKEVVIISGLSFEDKVYDKQPIRPNGVILVSGNKVPVDDLEVWYQNQSDWSESFNPPINAGKYKVYYVVPESNENYTGSTSYDFEIKKADPKILFAPNLSGVKGDELSTIELPVGYSWIDEHDELIIGEEYYQAIFTPNDTKNYNILNLNLGVYVKDIFRVETLVDGENGIISPSKDVIEGDEFEIEFTPNKGYMIDKVLLLNPILSDDNVIYMDVDTIEDNKYKLIVDQPYIVKVSYKKAPIVYEVISGANQTYVIDKNNEAAFRIDADYSLFYGLVYVDDILIGKDKYVSKEGSTIIKLKKEFVDTLSVGTHTLKVEFSDDGVSTTKFVIEANNENNPKTGDRIISIIIIGGISLFGLAGCCLYIGKRRKYN